MEDRPHGSRGGYSRQLADRLSRPVAAPAQQQLQPWAFASSKPRGHKKPPAAPKTLVDAFKQHGMQLCDGARLKAVGKRIQRIGTLPQSLSAQITSLYLSQNELSTLQGAAQFGGLRLLSLGGNALALVSELGHLRGLQQLRHLNLVGNPICQQPNYRFLVIDQLKQLQVLDTVEISKQERDVASFIASQDRAQREMILSNHFEIQKLQRIAQLVRLHRDLFGVVLADAASCSGRFDRLPGPQDACTDINTVLRVWKYEDTLSAEEKSDLELQMLTIVVRTHSRLARHPKVKAKEFLLRLGSAPKACALVRGGYKFMSKEIQAIYSSWEEAYANVVGLQQQTIVNLAGLCDRHQKETVEFLRKLLILDSQARRQVVAAGCQISGSKPMLTHSRRRNSNLGAVSTPGRDNLPPQQPDPETKMASQRPAVLIHEELECKESITVQPISTSSEEDRRQPSRSVTVPVSRGGEFGNKTLNEAVHGFKLRDYNAATEPPVTIPVAPQQMQVHMMRQPPPPHLKSIRSSSARTPDRDQQHEDPHSSLPSIRRDEHRGNDNHCSRDTSQRMRDSRISDVTRESMDLTTNASIFSESFTSRLSEPREYERLRVARRHSSEFFAVSEALLMPSTRPTQIISNQQLNQEYQEAKRTTQDHDMTAQVRSLKDQQQELEHREQKYIKALMESEQRELDLRNQIAGVQRKLVNYQQVLTRDISEREKIKREVHERVLAFAAPKVLNRFFIRWIHYYHWSCQTKHVYKKRCFIVQHDFFWSWRRAVWKKQQVLAFQRRKTQRSVRSHFAEWTNLTRLSVIAAHATEMRQLVLVRSIFAGWRKRTTATCVARRIETNRQLQKRRQLCRVCFIHWMTFMQQERHRKRLYGYRMKELEQITVQQVFWRWRIYLLSYARPFRERVALLCKSKQLERRRNQFTSWANLTKAAKLYRNHTCQRIWRNWAAGIRSKKFEQEQAMVARKSRARAVFSAWHVMARELASSRWSLSLAKRYVNQRRLRKLWAHWKFYSTARKKYIQGSTKALKHYFIKLLRHSWRNWALQTRQHALCVKEAKFGELRRHFYAFRQGIWVAMASHARDKRVHNMRLRKHSELVRKCMRGWRDVRNRRKCCKKYALVLERERVQHLLAFTWIKWRSSFIIRLQRAVAKVQRLCNEIEGEKRTTDDDLMVATDRSISLAEQICAMNKQVEKYAMETADYQQKLLATEESALELESELHRVQFSFDEAQREWEESREEFDAATTAQEQNRLGLLEENALLQKKILELENNVTAVKDRQLETKQENSKLRGDLREAHSKHSEELRVAENERKALEIQIMELKNFLLDEQKQREETATRLQNHERSIANACKAINEHEQAHERENVHLRYEHSHLEAKWKEEHARNAELKQLLQEKNETIIQLTQDLSNERLRTNAFDDVSIDIAQANASQRFSDNKTTRKTNQLDQSDHSARKMFQPTKGGTSSKEICGSTQSQSNHGCHSREAGADSIRPENDGERMRPRKHRMSQRGPKSLVGASMACPNEWMIDEHTSKIHEDLRNLQEKISHRLRQAPAMSESKLVTGRLNACGLRTSRESWTSLSEEDNVPAEIVHLSTFSSRPKQVTRKSAASRRETRQANTRATGSLFIRAPPSSSENNARMANVLLSTQAIASQDKNAHSKKLKRPARRPAAILAPSTIVRTKR